MKDYIFILNLIVLVGTCKNGSGQSINVREKNIVYIDSFRHVIETAFCQGDSIHPKVYDRREINKVLSILNIIDFLSKGKLTTVEVDSAFSKIKFGAVYKSNDCNGLLQTVEAKVTVKYLSANVKFVYIDNLLISIKIVLTPHTLIRCDKYGGTLLDFNVLRDIYARNINSLIRIVDMSYILIKKLDLDNLVKASNFHKDYQFFSEYLSNSGKDWTNNLFLKIYDPDSSCCYSYSKGQEDMIRLIRERRYDLIRDMAFSPNYFYAVNAMEGIIYLVALRKLQIDDRLKDRIERIKNDSCKLFVKRSPDVLGPVNGYKAINSSDEAVVRKYESSLR